MRKFLVLASLVCVANLSYAYDCKYEREIDRVVDIKGATLLEIEAGAGSLEIVGSKRSDVKIGATLCSSDEEALAKMDVSTQLSSGKAHIETEYPSRGGWRDSVSAKIDLVLLVPQSSELDVKDSSGEASVEGVAKLDMVDSSGRLKIEDIDGDVKVVDSSGELKIEDVAGDINLTDSSGGIYVSNVRGNMVVEADSSGGIEARQVGKDVLIKIDSSGRIDVKDVGGDFTVLKDSSGGIEYEDEAGKVKI